MQSRTGKKLRNFTLSSATLRDYGPTISRPLFPRSAAVATPFQIIAPTAQSLTVDFRPAQNRGGSTA